MPVSPIPAGYSHRHAVHHGSRGRRGSRLLQGRVRCKGEVMRFEHARGHCRTRRNRNRRIACDACRAKCRFGNRGPESLGGTTGGTVYLPCRTWTRRSQKAVAAGAKVFKPVQDQFYGDRSGTMIDPLRSHLDTRHTHRRCFGGRIAAPAWRSR